MTCFNVGRRQSELGGVRLLPASRPGVGFLRCLLRNRVCADTLRCAYAYAISSPTATPTSSNVALCLK